MSQENERTITADRDGVIRQWGGEVERVFGYTPEEAIGQRIDLIIPPGMQGFHWRGFNRAMATESMRHPDPDLKVPALHKSGEIIALRATLALTHGDDGSVNGAVSTIFGRGPAWRATAWRVVLVPLKAGAWLRGRMRRSTDKDLEAAGLRE
jgi:PAS domain S-box-containing protein